MSKSDWVSSGVVCSKLGINRHHLENLRKEGLLKLNKHYRSIGRPQAARPTYRYHIKRVEQALEIPMEVRG